MACPVGRDGPTPLHLVNRAVKGKMGVRAANGKGGDTVNDMGGDTICRAGKIWGLC